MNTARKTPTGAAPLAALCLPAAAAVLAGAGPAWAFDDYYVRWWEMADKRIIEFDGKIEEKRAEILRLNEKLVGIPDEQERYYIRSQAEQLQRDIDGMDAHIGLLKSEIAELESLGIGSWIDPDREAALARAVGALEAAYAPIPNFTAAIDRQGRGILAIVPHNSTLTAGDLEAAINYSAPVRLATEGVAPVGCIGADAGCPLEAGAPASTALVRGTANSVPSTEGMLFRVSIYPDVAAAFSYHNGYPSVGFKPGVSNQTVTIGLPIGLPLYGDMRGYHAVEFFGRDILSQDYTNGYCHAFITVAVNGSGDIYTERLVLGPRRIVHETDIVPRSELHAKWLGISETPPPPDPNSERIVSPPVPDGCGHVLAWPPFDPPYRQVHGDGVLAGSVACNDGLVLRLRDGAGGHEPLCVQPGTADELMRRGVLEGDLPAPRGHRVRP